jgi:hypothetical protein
VPLDDTLLAIEGRSITRLVFTSEAWISFSTPPAFRVYHGEASPLEAQHLVQVLILVFRPRKHWVVLKEYQNVHIRTQSPEPSWMRTEFS